MKILFAKITSLKFYKGIIEGLDEPKNGGDYVKRTGDAHEKFNFQAEEMPDRSRKCFGFFELKSNRGILNQLHLENIVGCEDMKYADKVEDVLVVWCAVRDKNMPRIVGWYKHATVYRDYKNIDFDGYIQSYNVVAAAENVVLVPWQERGFLKYEVPQAKQKGYGFGQSMQWYASEAEAQNYVKYVKELVENYDGVNDLEKGYLDSDF